ncbi:MAG: hypothetical protein HOP17_04400 [Acidobacteria bacterium]|nr:hypothetical protein [Acidobacteriota bacterium]
MSIAIEDLVTKINELKGSDRAELLRRLNESEAKNSDPRKPKTNRKNGYVSPETIWMRDRSGPYGGQYVALENGELVATGKGYPDTLVNARKAGALRPFITYVPREDEKLFGGW